MQGLPQGVEGGWGQGKHPPGGGQGKHPPGGARGGPGAQDGWGATTTTSSSRRRRRRWGRERCPPLPRLISLRHDREFRDLPHELPRDLVLIEHVPVIGRDFHPGPNEFPATVPLPPALH